MIYYKWNNLDDFNVWHEAVKAGLGLPKYGINDATGEIDINAQMTENYALPIIETDGVNAIVEAEIAATYTENLGVISVGPDTLKTVIDK